LTTQSIKETQILIEEKLGISNDILSRTIFHGQHSMNELLEATDAKLKEEFALVVPLWLWQDAASLARAKARSAGTKAAEFNGMVSLRSEDVEKLAKRRDGASYELESKQKDLERMDAHLQEQMRELEGYEEMKGNSPVEFGDIEERLQEATAGVNRIESRREALFARRDADLSPLQKSYTALTNSLVSLADRCNARERDVFAASLKVDATKEKVEQLEAKWDVDLSSGRLVGFETPEACPTCQQPISGKGDGHSHDDLKRLAEGDIDSALVAYREARDVLVDAKENMFVFENARTAEERAMQEAKKDLEEVVRQWGEEVTKLEDELIAKRQEQAQFSAEFSSMAKKAQKASELGTLETSINSKRAATSFSNDTYTAICEELKEGESRLEELKSKMEDQTRLERAMKGLSESFGPRGVQTFVLQNVVEVLQTISQTYLDDLSDGSQRLVLSLDAGDRISRTASVRGADGDFKERPLSTLSGGQWRRCSLALTLGFAELLARRGKMRPSLCILDEPLTHLDRTGRTKVGEVMRKMLYPQDDSVGIALGGGLGISTIIVILQDLSAEELEEAFDKIDEVVKYGGHSVVKVDESS
jgi:DNA repair exonuclease SbcCD ATPase subunit